MIDVQMRRNLLGGFRRQSCHFWQLERNVALLHAGRPWAKTAATEALRECGESERHARTGPVIGARRRASDCLRGFAPSLRRVSTRAPAPKVQQALAACIEPEEAKDLLPLSRCDGTIAANQLVVRHSTIGKRDRTPRERAKSRPQRTPGTEHERIEQVALQTDEAIGRAVVVRARQRRNEIDVPGRPALHEASARDLDRYVDRDRSDGRARCAARRECRVRGLESPAVFQPGPAPWPWPNMDLFCSDASRFSARRRVSTTDA